MSNREIVEGLQYQGTAESVTYRINTSKWTNGTTPSAATANIYTLDGAGALVDVTATNMSGTAAIDGEQVTLPQISGLTYKQLYLVKPQFTAGSDTMQPIAWIEGGL